MKNKTRKIITLTFAILLIVLIQAIGVTYAKYITSEKGTGEAQVAKWGFEFVKDGEETKNIKLVDTTNKDTLVNGKIAPGTSGEILIEVDGTASEVDLDYTIQFSNEQNKPENLHFTVLGKEYKTLSEIDALRGKIEYDSDRKIRNFLIYWEWKYETGTTTDEKNTNNQIDTENANNITEYTFDVVATATQSE